MGRSAAFLHATLNHPRAARLLRGERTPNPKTGDEVEDHNVGVQLLRSLNGYLGRKGRAALEFFDGALDSPKVAALVAEAEDARRNWREDRSGDRRWFDRMQEMRSRVFARARARELRLAGPAARTDARTPGVRLPAKRGRAGLGPRDAE